MRVELNAVQARAQDENFVNQCSLQALQTGLPLLWPTPPDTPPSPKKQYRSHYLYLGWNDLLEPSVWEYLSDFDLLLRLIDFSPLRPVLAQRLVRRVCKECARPFKITDEWKKVFDKYEIDYSKANLKKGKGCNTCMNSGYKGRAGIHELLIMNDDIRKMMLTEVAAGPIRELAVKAGMRLMIKDGLIKVTQGITTVEEILAATL